MAGISFLLWPVVSMPHPRIIFLYQILSQVSELNLGYGGEENRAIDFIYTISALLGNRALYVVYKLSLPPRWP